MTSVYFAELPWTELRELLGSPRTPVLLLPVGATEPHGPHLPLATDPLISLGMCARVAERLRNDPELRALVLPSIDYGVTRYARAFPGAVHVNEDTLHALLVDVGDSLIRQGFRHLVIVNNHFEPEHVQTLHRVLDTLEERHGAPVGYLDLTRRHRAERLTDEVREGGSHAGQYETSLVLADRPVLVGSTELPDVPVNLAERIAGGADEFVEMGLTDAYNGTPARASSAEGEETFERLADMLESLVRELVRGEGGRDAPGMYGRRNA